jgi:hypothetical protein
VITHTLRFTLPAAYALLPPVMASPEASAMLLAIGLQESRFLDRQQRQDGPARGFWQFERAGIKGVLHHRSTGGHVTSALRQLRYETIIDDVRSCHALVEHNDTVAAIFARLLLWTLPKALPARDDPEQGWFQYLDAWRPGRPHYETWTPLYTQAWHVVMAERGLV